MKNKNVIYPIFYFVLGTVLLIFGIYLLLSKDTIVEGQIIGIIVGIGSGIFGIGLLYMLKNFINRKNPKYLEKLDIELCDERNITVKTKSEAKTGKFIHWINIVFCLGLTIMSKHVNIPYWIIIFVALSIVLYPFLMIYYIKKIGKEI